MLRAAAIGLLACLAVLLTGQEAALFLAERSPIARDLPEGEALARLLGSCQITSEFGPEVTLCPQAHRADAFAAPLHAALLASEDHRFLAHDGVDPWAVLRAGLGLVGLAAPTGGSTITQQLARTLFLSRDHTYGRKLREWILARRIERVASKSQILTYYLNVAPQGHGLFGFEAASRHFLGKPARDLTVMQSALLASMLPRPVRDPLAAPVAAYRATVARIDLMLDQGFVDDEQALAAKREARAAILHGGLPAVPAAERRLARRPFEYRRVRDLALRQLDRQGVADDAAARVFVTLDPRFQRWADAAADAAPAGYAGAALFMRPGGDVLAVAGPAYATQQYNAAFEATRSLGSLGKVPLYVLAHEQPALLQRRFPSEPLRGAWPGEPSARCATPMLLREALAYSCNRPFAHLSRTLAGRARDYVGGLGLEPPENPVLTGLGGVHGNLLSATAYFAAIANGGRLVAPRAALAVADRDGRVRHAAPPAPARRVMSRETARAVAVDLRAPVRAEGGTAGRAAGRARAAHVAGKTGTSDGNRDAWFVGFTQDFVGGISAHAAGGSSGIGGGGYPAEQFGRIVDAYWVPKNARAALGPPDPAEGAQALAFGWSGSRLVHRLQAAARTVGGIAALLALAWLLRPARWQMPRPRPRAGSHRAAWRRLAVGALRIDWFARLRRWRPQLPDWPLRLEGRGAVPDAVLSSGAHRP